MTRTRSVFFVAVEPSADLLARETIEQLRATDPSLRITGIGGAQMAQAGVPESLDLSALAIVGFIEGLKAYGAAIKLADAVTDQIIDQAPDAVVLIDSWGFMLRVAQRVKKRAPHIPILKLVGPQVWATRAGRAKTLAQTVDHLICIHAMEAAYYEPYGLPVTVMGNPALSRAAKAAPDRLKQHYGWSETETVVLLLPGSRHSEIEQVAPTLMSAAENLQQRRPKVRVVFAPAESVRAAFQERFPEATKWGYLIDADLDMTEVMAGSDYALACSGTVTSELAVQGVPFLVAYRTGGLTWFLARYFLYKPNHITLLNIAADDSTIVPEFLQTDLEPEALITEALRYVDDPGLRHVQIKAQNRALERMRLKAAPAAKIAADTILDYVT